MSLWWAKREQLDKDQVDLIENLSMEGNYLVLGPPGSGKTNVLLRRAQFTRTQGMPNVLLLTFTRALSEFLKTGCINSNGSEVFPPSLIMTIESWIRGMYRSEGISLPDDGDFDTRKALLASGAKQIASKLKQPPFDVIFVDEAQDLTMEEVELLKIRARRLFFVGDDRQKIYSGSNGMSSIDDLLPSIDRRVLSFHYRIAPEICGMADRIMSGVSGKTLTETCHYDGPRPGRINTHQGAHVSSISSLIQSLKAQLRAYGDRIAQGDRLGIVVPRRNDRQEIANALENETDLASKWQIVRARTGDDSDRNYNPALDASRPILIMTEQACKGLEFRALHWMFVDDLAHYRTDERYYTIVTRAKTSIDIYHEGALPSPLAKSYAPPVKELWS